MGLWSTLVGLGACAILGLFARIRSAREPDPNNVRLVPWTTILIGCVVLGILLMAHLLNLAGIETGRSRF